MSKRRKGALVGAAVTAIMMVGTGAAAYFLGSFQAGNGSVTSFALDIEAQSNGTFGSRIAGSNISTTTHTVTNGVPVIEIQNAIDGSRFEYATAVRNGNDTVVRVSEIVPIWDGDPAALQFTYVDNACDNIPAGSNADAMRIEIEVLDASLITGTETLSYRLSFDDTAGGCSAPAVGSVMTPSAS